jgi:drug/metabolite transporter (DMT)-like permease
MQDTSHKILGISAALGSAASWALGAILFKLAGERMSPAAMTLAKGAMSVLLLGIAVLVIGYHPSNSGVLWLLVLSGVIGIALGDTFFFKALQDLTPVSIIVLMVVGQIMTALLGILVLKEAPTPLAWLGMACIMVGVVAVLYGDVTGDVGQTKMRGILFGLAAVSCMSVSSIIAKRPLESVPTIQATFVRMAAGTLGVFLVGGMLGQVGGWLAPLKDFSFLAKFLLAVVVVSFGGFWLSIVAIKFLQVAVASALNSTEPIFAIPLSLLIMKDRTNPRAILGSIAVVAGVALISCAENPA